VGFFKDIAKVTKQANEINRDFSVKDQMASMQASMAAANQAMGQFGQDLSASTQAMNAGVAAVATITSARQTGAMLNHNPMVQLELLVPVNGIPIPVQHQCVVMQLHLVRAQPGGQVHVKVMPDNPNDIWVDWVTAV
jgi:hypothetical protein